MNKAELVKALEERLGSRKAAQEALEVVLDTIVREVAKGGRVAITGFGTFEKAARAARTGRNPRTGEVVKIKKTSVPRFKAGTSFKGYVADPRSLPKAAPAAARAAAGTVTSVAGTALGIAESAVPGRKSKKAAPAKKTSTATKTSAKNWQTARASSSEASGPTSQFTRPPAGPSRSSWPAPRRWPRSVSASCPSA